MLFFLSTTKTNIIISMNHRDAGFVAQHSRNILTTVPDYFARLNRRKVDQTSTDLNLVISKNTNRIALREYSLDRLNTNRQEALFTFL